ncbi:MAG: 3-isopropylmalate dehydratase small subunit [Microbacteriaceae bacterium]|nr:3-isopropylmalate dehydratase small subunit [Microbacteriaceae bacterium]
MEKVTVIEGVAVPLKRSNVDTDQIIPAEFLKRVSKTGFDDALFYAWRQDPAFVLNNPAFKNPKVLIAGPDFGTGSSREHAVWALRDFGFRAVFSPRFGDIFRGNSGKQGLLTGIISEADLEALWRLIDAEPGIQASVDLHSKTVKIGSHSVPFEIDDYTRWRLLEGLDDISLTLRDEAKISSFEASRANWLPKTLPAK